MRFETTRLKRRRFESKAGNLQTKYIEELEFFIQLS